MCAYKYTIHIKVHIMRYERSVTSAVCVLEYISQIAIKLDECQLTLNYCVVSTFDTLPLFIFILRFKLKIIELLYQLLSAHCATTSLQSIEPCQHCVHLSQYSCLVFVCIAFYAQYIFLIKRKLKTIVRRCVRRKPSYKCYRYTWSHS